MGIVISKEDSNTVIRQKLEEADEQMRALIQQDVMSLSGVLKGKIEGDPVEIIRKMRDEEWD